MSSTAPTIPLGTGVRAITMVIQTNNNTATPVFAGDGQMTYNRFEHFFRRLVLGAFNSNITIIRGGAYATGTATLATVVATNTLVIGGVTLTCVNSGASSVQFNKGTTDTLTAVNLAAAINALTTINKVVQATSSGAIVTIASLIPGTVGNLITLSAGGGTITVGAALTGGTDGTKGVISKGL